MIHCVCQLLEVKKYVSLEQKSLHIPRVCVDNGHNMLFAAVFYKKNPLHGAGQIHNFYRTGPPAPYSHCCSICHFVLDLPFTEVRWIRIRIFFSSFSGPDAFCTFITSYLSSIVPSYYTDSNVHLYPDPQEITVRTQQ
jgi:hypothetical protein